MAICKRFLSKVCREKVKKSHLRPQTLGYFLKTSSRSLYDWHLQSSQRTNSKELSNFLALKLYISKAVVSQAHISQQKIQNSEA